MKTYNQFLYDIFTEKYDKQYNYYMNRYKYYFINQYSLTIKNIFPIISLLFYNEFTEKLNKDYIVRYTLIALCSILNEREDVIRLLKKDIMGEFNENLIENIRLTILTILELYKKIEKKDIYYLDIFKDTRNFISFLIIMFEFIKQNNFKYIDFIKYKDNIDNVILDKIKKKYNNINK